MDVYMGEKEFATWKEEMMKWRGSIESDVTYIKNDQMKMEELQKETNQVIQELKENVAKAKGAIAAWMIVGTFVSSIVIALISHFLSKL